MRLVMVVVAMAAACDGDTSGRHLDAGAVDANDTVDADLGITGTWRDTYITAAGTSSQSVCDTAPTALVVDPATAAITPYPGTCKPDGAFQISATGNLGAYYLRVQGALYETTKRAGLDLSKDHLGRADVAGITSVNLRFDVASFELWSTGDVLMAFGANIGFFQNLSFTSGGPASGGTALTGTAPWGGYKIEAAKSDALQIVHLDQQVTGSGYTYLALARAFAVPAFTMANNTTHDLVGTFYTPPPGTLSLAIDVASFDQYRLAANPNSTSRTVAGSAYAAPSPDVVPSPALISFARDSSTLSTMSFGTISYTDPFPTPWQRFVKVQQAFAVPYVWNNVQGSFNAQLTRVLTKDEAEAGTIAARLSPPLDPRFDGNDAFTATTITTVPVVTWQTPALGSPTDYEVQVYEAQIAGSSLKFVSTLRLQTKRTSVRIPAGYLLGQRQYIFVIRARMRDTVDMYTTPLRAGTSTSSADTLTALVTTS